MQNHFISINPNEIDPVFQMIGQNWMLIGASDGTRTNIMTASWGCLGVLWNTPVAVCFIRPQRYTHAIVECTEHLSLSFFNEQSYRSALAYCGRVCGKNEDKFAGAGLTCLRDENGTPYPQEANLVLLCHKLYADDLKQNAFLSSDRIAEFYVDKDFHRMYICKIEQALYRESVSGEVK